MEAALHAIERACAPSLAGLKKIVVIDPNDLATQPLWFLLPNIASLSFKPGKAAYAFENDRLNGTLVGATDTNNAAGDYYTYTLNARVSGLVLDVEFFRRKIKNRRVHVVATYRDGLQRFVPNMRISARDESGSRGDGRNFYTFQATTRLLSPAPTLAGVLSVIGGAAPDLPAEIDGGVTIIPLSTTDSTYTYIVPAGKILAAVYIRSTSAQTISLGTTPGGEELGGPIPLLALQYGLLGSNLIRPTTNTTIYFSGLAGTNTIEIWLLG